jgi:hypothetical protein
VLRGIFAVAAGLFAAMIVISGLELVCAKWLYPLPQGFDPGNAAQLQAFVSAMPAPVQAWIVGGWLLGAFAGGSVGARLDARYPWLPATLVGAFVAIATWMNAQGIAHPAWMVVLGVLLPIPVALLGARLLRKVSPVPGK